MTITCFIEYKIKPEQVCDFEVYATNWLHIIPRCGASSVNYYLPHEGTNFCAYGLISFCSLAKYEHYRSVLKSDEQGKANFAFAAERKFIVEERRTFLRHVEMPESLNLPESRSL